MRTNILTIAALSLFTLFTFSGCKKDNKNSTDIFTSKTWKRGLTDKNPSTNPPGKVLYNPVQNCEKDDTFKFATDGSFIVNRNAEKCDPDELQNETDTYTLNTTTKEFVINGVSYTLAEESANQIKYYVAIPSQTGYNYMVFLLQ
jgi:hypothetical protein